MMRSKASVELSLVAVWVLVGLSNPSVVFAQAGVSGGYSQNFNTLITTGSAASLPAGINEWSFAETGTCDTNPDYDADAGTSNTGDTYSYGTGTASDRALGALASGNCTTRLGSRFSNDTGSSIGRLAINFNCEHWRRADGVSTLAFEYNTTTGCTINSATGWTAFAGLSCTETDTGTGSTSLDGNVVRTAVASTISGLTISNGNTFCIRWSNTDVTGSDDGLGLDDFNLNPQSPTAIGISGFRATSSSPAGFSFLWIALGLTPAMFLTRRRRA